METWNRLNETVISATLVNAFEGQLDRLRTGVLSGVYAGIQRIPTS